MRFENQVVWLTGASSGIGEALAYEFSKQGAQLILSARRGKELERVCAQCVGNGAATGNSAATVPYILPLDVADLDSIPRKAEQARALFGRIDILVNNAGISQRGLVAETEMVALQRVFQVNFFGAVAMTKAVLLEMLERRAGQIVVVSSLTGKLPLPKHAAYCASKHALQGYFDSLRAEVARAGVKVTVILPGFVQSEISANSMDAQGLPRGQAAASRRAMRADVAARKMVQAIAQGKAEYEFGGVERFAVPLRKYAPWLYSYAIKRMKI
ncbi:MAG: SDR family oxidoreductase [Chloroflexi bacterium]|nr:SDR family oxidoreductase [Chloroflexota bacterium]